MTPEVLLETRGPLGLVTLHRPKALNALDLGMIRALHPALEAWAREDAVKAVVVRGAGGRAFCAGGDVRAVAASLDVPPREGQEPLVRAFFREEYRLNQLIHHFSKPHIALVEGICMGGGLGLSAHGSHLEWVIEALGAADWDAGPAHAVATQVLDGLASDPGPSQMRTHAEAIDRCFAKGSIEEILAALEAEGTAWAEETRATLGRMSPTSLKVTLRQLRLCRDRPYDEVVDVEYRLSQHCTARPDFREGVRAVLVDKDHQPRWSPPTLAEVKEPDVEACFAPVE